MLQNFPMYAYIPATDLARARQFYEGKLGLRPKEETNGGVVYDFANGTACFLSRHRTQAPPEPARRSGPSRTWTV